MTVGRGCDCWDLLDLLGLGEGGGGVFTALSVGLVLETVLNICSFGHAVSSIVSYRAL